MIANSIFISAKDENAIFTSFVHTGEGMVEGCWVGEGREGKEGGVGVSRYWHRLWHLELSEV